MSLMILATLAVTCSALTITGLIWLLPSMILGLTYYVLTTKQYMHTRPPIKAPPSPASCDTKCYKDTEQKHWTAYLNMAGGGSSASNEGCVSRQVVETRYPTVEVAETFPHNH